MIETEVKVKVKDFTHIRERLTHLGFKKVRLKRETDIYYDHSLRGFRQTREILRIRQSDRNTITYKCPISSRQTKARVEYDSDISDAEMMSKILESLGFRPSGTVIKSREIWKFNGVLVNLDYVSSLGRFVEVEIISPSCQDISNIEERLFLIIKQLGLNINHLTTKSYIELIHESHLK